MTRSTSGGTLSGAHDPTPLGPAPSSASTVAMNHLLLGKKPLVAAKPRRPPIPGSVPTKPQKSNNSTTVSRHNSVGSCASAASSSACSVATTASGQSSVKGQHTLEPAAVVPALPALSSKQLAAAAVLNTGTAAANTHYSCPQVGC